MKHKNPCFYKELTFLIFLTAGVFISVTAQSNVPAQKEIQSRLDTYLNPYLEERDFSGVAIITRDNSVLAQKTYGFADIKNKIPNKLNTKFRVASLTKTFTAAAIVMLADKGKLNLSDPLSKFYPQFPNGQNIKIEHLLLHQSGVGSLDEPRHHQNCYSAEQLVEEIGKVKPNFPPGTSGGYSNEGYNLLAAIIEKVSGETYENFLRKNIFQPLGMKDSGSYCSELKVKNLAAGYVTGAAVKTVEELPFAEFVQMGSGSVYSTALDLHKWLKAVAEKRLFDLEKLRYPYGWGRREYTGNKLIEQSGLVEGFMAYMALYPAEKVYMVFLSNIQSGLFNRVPKDLKAVAFGGEFTRPPALAESKISNAKFEEYAGAYRTPNISVPLNVILKNGNLYLRWGNYSFMRSLTPVSKDKFFHRAEYTHISFERNENGRIEKIKWQSDAGGPMILEKVSIKPDGAGDESMILISGATFEMGTDISDIPKLQEIFNIKHAELFSEETPLRKIKLDLFYLDKTEVTNADFKRFLDKNSAWQKDKIPSEFHNGKYLQHWNGNDFPKEKANHPVVFVPWYAAVAYCQSLGKRLPTEAEWEFAARGGLFGKHFPWGDEMPDKKRANFGASEIGAATAVGSYPPNGYGLFDMAGNVWEFLADEWQKYPANIEIQINPVAGGDFFYKNSYRRIKTRRVIRGASYGGVPVNLRVAYCDSHLPENAGDQVGFRCAQNVPVKDK